MTKLSLPFKASELSKKFHSLDALHYGMIICTFLILVLSLTAYTYNALVTHYRGNAYLPPDSLLAFFLLALICLGLRLSFSPKAWLTVRFNGLLAYYTVLFTIGIATLTAQLTPFTPIDPWLIKIEHYFSVDNGILLNWLSDHPLLRQVLSQAYGSLPLQMTVIPLTLIAFNQKKNLNEYYFLLLSTVLIGFTLYYFWPSIAPASFIENPYFIQSQRDTGLKFYQIHYHMEPTTFYGGLIAFPSFHFTWAWICLYVVRRFAYLWWPLLFNNCLLACSCVMLGWHYLTDLLGSVVILWIAHRCLARARQ